MTARLRTYGEMAEILDDIPTIVKAHRRERGLSLRAASEEIGIAFGTLQKIERGNISFGIGSLKLILEWLNGTTRKSGPNGGSDLRDSRRGDPGSPTDLAAGEVSQGIVGAA